MILDVPGITEGDLRWPSVVMAACPRRFRDGPALRGSRVPGPFPGSWAETIPGRQRKVRRWR